MMLDISYLVFRLPHDLAVGLLSSWLTLPDIAHLDSSICNHKKHTSLLSLFSSREMVGIGQHFIGAFRSHLRYKIKITVNE